MSRTNYFHLPLPKGIAYDGHFYTVLSPIDKRAGLKRKTITLIDESGLEIKLARSSSTREFTAANLFSERASMQESVSNIIASSQPKSKEFFQMSEVRNFGAEILKVLRCWYGHFMEADKIPDEVLAKHQNAFKRFAKLETVDQDLEARRNLLNLPFKNLEAETSDITSVLGHSAFGIQLRDLSQYHFKGFIEKSLTKGPLRKLREELEHELISQNGTRSEINPIHTLNLLNSRSDFFDEALKLFSGDGNKLFYNPWDSELPSMIMRYDKSVKRQPKNSIGIIFEDGKVRYYRRQKDVGEAELAIILKCMIDAVNLRDVNVEEYSKNRVVRASELATIFPISYDFCSMTLEETTEHMHRRRETSSFEFSVNIEFPQYGVVDPEKRDHIFIMPAGIAGLNYELSLDSPMRFIDYTLIRKCDDTDSVTAIQNARRHSEHDDLYENFFNIPGYVCGVRQLDEREAEESNISLSSLVWENFIRLYSVLTDGLKHQSANSRDMAIRYAKVDCTVAGKTFKRYMPRKEFEAFNETLKAPDKLYIGDGRIK